MGFKEEVTANQVKSEYVFYEEKTTNMQQVQIIAQPEECYVCTGDGPLFYLCVCRNYGRCKKCTLDMYARGETKCTICDENYVYETEDVKVFNAKGCIKEWCETSAYITTCCLVFAIIVFIIVGFSYTDTFYDTYEAEDKAPVQSLLIISYVLTGIFNIVGVCVSCCLYDSDRNVTNVRDWLSFRIFICQVALLVLDQIIGATIIYIKTGEFIFNIVSLCVGSLFTSTCIILLGILYGVLSCIKCVKKEISESYTVTHKTIKLPTSV